MATVAFDDITKELEWQKTNLALGNPVDAELLLEVCEQLRRENDGLRAATEEAEKALTEAEAYKEDLIDKMHERLEKAALTMEVVAKEAAISWDKKFAAALNNGAAKARAK